MRATVTVTGPTRDALSAALDIASSAVVTYVREGEGWEDGGSVTYAIVIEGEDDDVDVHPVDCAACAAGEPSVHAYEAPTLDPQGYPVGTRYMGADHIVRDALPDDGIVALWGSHPCAYLPCTADGDLLPLRADATPPPTA